jgi:hypothetical protein
MAQKRNTTRKLHTMEQQTSAEHRNWRQYFSKLKSPSQFSKPQLALFILAFALIGYLIYHTFAAAPLIASVQAEQMTPQIASATGANSSVSETGSAQVVLASSATFSNLTRPTLSGSPVVGSSLKVSNGTWSPTPTSYLYAWWRCDGSGGNCNHFSTAEIKSTASSYTLLSGDVGYTIKVQVAPNGAWTQSEFTAPSSKVTAAAVTKTFGHTSIGGTWTGGLNANDRFIQKFTLNDNAQVSKLSYYLKGDGAASQVAKAIIYADSNGSPAALMGQGAGVTVRGGQVAGWVSFPFATPIILTPGNYWIGLIRGDTGGTIDVATDKSGGTEAFAPDTYSDGAMNPFGTVKGTSTYSLSGYATYTVGSSMPAGFTKIVNDGSASNGQEMELTANGTIKSTFSLPSTAASMTVVAKADLCNSLGAAMTVNVDGNQLISATVSSTALSTFTTNTNLAGGSHSLAISYTNDTSASTCDRNLYIDVTNFYGPNVVTSPPTVALSASPTSVTSGQSSTLTWTSTNASSCSASGAWSGTEPTSGSLSTGALNQNSTYTLTCTGTGGSAIASATVTVSTTTSGGTPGIGVLAYGGNLKYVLNLNGYSMVIGSSYSSDSPLLQSTAGRGLTYFAGSDVNTTYSTGVPSSQASANGWLLYCGTILCTNKGFANDYIGDIGSSGYQQAFITNVENYLAAHPGTDGVFIDDVLYTATGLIGSYPNKYPSLSSWSSAQVSFVKAVYAALHSKGYYVALNASGYVPGDANSNTSANEQTFWKMVGPYSDGLMNEWYDETASGITTAQLRSTGAAWYQEWDSWQQIIPLIQSMGKDFIGLTKQTCTNTTAMTYGKASFLLEWNGGGGAYIYTCGGSTDPTNTAWTKNVGTPSAAKVQVGVGWERTYTKGTVLVNPSPTASQTFSVNGTSYTLSPTTARIL